jgi:hypothetical protein
MSVNAVSGGGRQFVTLESDNVGQSAFTSVSGELAVLMLENQQHQKQLEHDELSSARQDYGQALSNEVQSLRDQADASFRGALLQGSLAAASGAAGAWAAGAECKPGERTWQGATSDALGKLAEPMGKLVSKTFGAADAKSAQGAEEAARWQIDDAQSAVKDADGLQSKTLDWASSMSERDASTMSAILSNKV